MCIAIYKPTKVTLTKNVLKTCFKNNPDGAGFAYPTKKKDKVIIEKGFFSFRSFWVRYRAIQAKFRPMLIHFRVATSGSVDIDNCHPWRIDESHAFIHNGVVQHKLGLQSEDCSDTGLFVEHILKPTFASNDEVWKTPAYKWCIQEAIGIKNKMAILDKDGEVIVFNEKEGVWDGGAWFSNETFKTARKTTAKIGDAWIETRPDGSKWQVRIKNGHTKSYCPVKNALTLGNGEIAVKPAPRQSNDSKIMSWASRQTGVPIGPVPYSAITDDEPEADILAATEELQNILTGVDADISMMH